jgi:hypothetical protein
MVDRVFVHRLGVCVLVLVYGTVRSRLDRLSFWRFVLSSSVFARLGREGMNGEWTGSRKNIYSIRVTRLLSTHEAFPSLYPCKVPGTIYGSTVLIFITYSRAGTVCVIYKGGCVSNWT